LPHEDESLYASLAFPRGRSNRCGLIGLCWLDADRPAGALAAAGAIFFTVAARPRCWPWPAVRPQSAVGDRSPGQLALVLGPWWSGLPWRPMSAEKVVAAVPPRQSPRPCFAWRPNPQSLVFAAGLAVLLVFLGEMGDTGSPARAGQHRRRRLRHRLRRRDAQLRRATPPDLWTGRTRLLDHRRQAGRTSGPTASAGSSGGTKSPLCSARQDVGRGRGDIPFLTVGPGRSSRFLVPCLAPARTGRVGAGCRLGCSWRVGMAGDFAESL